MDRRKTIDLEILLGLDIEFYSFYLAHFRLMLQLDLHIFGRDSGRGLGLGHRLGLRHGSAATASRLLLGRFRLWWLNGDALL